jgi:hypothetical protein
MIIGKFDSHIEIINDLSPCSGSYSENVDVDSINNIILSSYSWDWATYIKKLKRKITDVWTIPSELYEFGHFHGITIIKFAINPDGTLLCSKILKHEGNQKLKISSLKALQGIFPLERLPKEFPDEHLILIMRLSYIQQ